MKKLSVLLLFIFMTALKSYAQDTLKRIDGSTIFARVDSVNKYDISYSYYKYEDEVVKRRISKSMIASIAYANGMRDTLFVIKGKDITSNSPMLHKPDDTLYQLGRRDAKRYYNRYNGASTGTLVATFPGSPVLGLIVGTACSLTPPKDKNMDFPNAALANNTAYHDGYFKKARAIKAGKVWASFGIGVLLNAALYFILNK